MGSVPNPIASSHEIDTHIELQQQIYRHARLWGRDVISQRLRLSFLTHVKKLAAIIVILGFAFWLWYGASPHHAPRTSYPYYDTQKPVPPWSEPMPLQGNYDREQGHK